MDNSPSPNTANMSQFNNQCVDPQDLYASYDFNSQINSPVSGNGKARMPVITSSLTSPTSAISHDLSDEQRLMRPSHDYGRFKQQTGLPTQADLSLFNTQGMLPGYNTGLYESQVWDNLQTPMDPNFEAFLEMSAANEDFIDPTAIMKQEEVQASIRYFPGMHQAAALQKQALAEKQRQRQAESQQQQQQQQQRAQSSRRSASSQPLDARTEETISRVMNEIRRRSDAATDSMSPPNGSQLPHVIRARKDEEEMDEDERLLNSEEGKKLSSKERRQLRNKVSARAFRSRRKEYIGQLEGELAAKANEAADYKRQNILLMEENARFRSLAEKLLAHPAFHPFLEDLSRDPDLSESLSKVSNPSSSSQSQMPKDIDPYTASQQLYPPSNSNTHVGMTMIPEIPVDLSALNLGSVGNWNTQSHGMSMYQAPQVFSVTEVPAGPADPLAFDNLSGKADKEDIFSKYEESEEAEEKASMPQIDDLAAKSDAPADISTSCFTTPDVAFDENDPTVTLFAISAPSPSAANIKTVTVDEVDTQSSPVTPERSSKELSDQLSRMLARFESSSRKIDSLLGC